MENLFRAYIKTADALKKQIEYLKTKINESTDVDERKALSKRSETLYSEYLDVLFSARMIENYFKPKPNVSISKKDAWLEIKMKGNRLFDEKIYK